MTLSTCANRSFCTSGQIWRKSIALCVLIVAIALSGCSDVAKVVGDIASQKTDSKTTVTASVPPQAKPTNSSGTIRIASFNIQVFGVSKLKKPQAMDVLTKVVRQFDVVAIQEVRAKEDTVLPDFVDMINADGSRYDFVIGERLGRTTSKEQYAYVYNTQTIQIDSQSIWTVPDPDDRLHREPLVARFRARGVPSDRAFTFSLVNIHTDPDETVTELNALDEVFQAVQQSSPREDDVILLGDLNVDDRHLGQLGRLPDMGWVIQNQKTNTRGTAQYDNIVFNQVATTEYTGVYGVLNLQQEFGLTEKEALEVSDHCPIWAEFSATEGGAGMLAGGERTVR